MPATSAFCPGCGRAAAGSRPGGTLPATTATGSLPGLPGALAPPIYAGFWLRFGAAILDTLVFLPVSFVLFAALGLTGSLSAEPDPEQVEAFMASYLIVLPLSLAVGWLYFALMESSTHQATLGKKVLGLKVTDLDGNRVSFGRATGRFFGKYLSGLIFYFGFIMAAFTEKKQALHDLIAGCLVLKRRV